METLAMVRRQWAGKEVITRAGRPVAMVVAVVLGLPTRNRRARVAAMGALIARGLARTDGGDQP